MKSAESDGWPATRLAVFRRDLGCVAVQPQFFGRDIATDQCRDAAGFLMRWNDLFKLELDHVRVAIGGMRIDAEAFLQAVCPWHHRGSKWRIDTKLRRAVSRERLGGLYPEAWAAV